MSNLARELRVVIAILERIKDDTCSWCNRDPELREIPKVIEELNSIIEFYLEEDE